MPLPVTLQLVLVAAGAALFMVVIWAIQWRTRNAGIVDVAWGAAIGAAGLFLAATSSGDASRRCMVAAAIGLWSLRLTVYLFQRVVGHPEEGRYATLRAQWGEAANARLFWFFQLQAATVVLFATPPLVAVWNAEPLGQPLDYLAAVVWILGVGGVALSDAQLAAFKRRPDSKGKTCRSGLWRYSRHPNYFFEWLHWWAYLLWAAGNPWQPLAALAPLVLLYFLLYVTGIPPTEAQAVTSRGDDYRDYQRTTSAFLPWFPQSNP